jgi:iron(III) transport system permease protein
MSMKTRLAEAVLASALAAVLGWPLLATVLVALGDVSSVTDDGGRLLSPAPADVSTGGVRRPIGLAFETVRLVLATEALALPAGLPLAFLLFRTDAWGRRGLLGLLAVAALVPLPLHATAWLGAFGNAGRSQAIGSSPWLAGWSGAAFVHAMAALPWIVLVAGVGLRAVEPNLEEAALLDLPAWKVALRVTLRRGMGAIIASAIAVAVLTAGDMTVTDLLSVRTYAEEAYLQFSLGNGPGAAGAVALPPLIVLGALVGFGALCLLFSDPARLASAAGSSRTWRLGKWRVPVGVATVAVVGNFVALPLYSLVWRAGRVGGYAASGQPPRWSIAGFLGTLRFAWDETFEPLWYSAFLAAMAATAAVALAWSLAWASRRPGVWRWVTLLSVATALALPGPVAGMGLVYAYRWFPDFYDSSAMVVLAGVLRTFSYALLVLWPSVRTIPPAFLDAAAVDGLGPWGVAWRVAIPMTRPAIVAAWGVSFVLSLGELPATNIITPSGFTPMTVRIWGLLHTGVESHLAGVALVMLAAVSAAGLPVALALGRLSRARPSR